MRDLLRRLQGEVDSPAPTERLCQGTLISREQYLLDVDRWGYQDARIRPYGTMTPEDVGRWTAAIHNDE
jgi:hypothetical protein